MNKKPQVKNKTKPLITIFTRILLVFLIIFIVSTLIVYLKGKKLVEHSLTSAIGRKVTIGKLFYDFPFGLRAFHLNIEGLAKSKDFKVQFDASSLLRKETVFKLVSLNSPIVNISETADLKTGQSNPTQEKTNQAKDVISKAANSNVLIDKLIVTNGRFVLGNDLLPDGSDLVLEKVTLNIDDLMLPLQKGRIKFNGNAELELPQNPFNGSSLQASGWMDWVTRSADVDLTLSQGEGENKITAKAAGENNLLTVNGEMGASNLLFGFSKPKAKNKDNAWMNSFPFANIGSVTLKFSFQTPMDAPKLEPNISFSGKVFEDKNK